MRKRIKSLIYDLSKQNKNMLGQLLSFESLIYLCFLKEKMKRLVSVYIYIYICYYCIKIQAENQLFSIKYKYLHLQIVNWV